MRYYALFFILVLSIPVFWGMNVVQSNECGRLKHEIRSSERTQEQYVNDQKTIANEIAELLAIERVEAQARKQGLKKVRPEDVILIIMGRNGNEL